ncbi:putative sodium/calcium exchanger membrane region, EF-hand domain pair [Rosa chinensis]|uniref:Putative sodium/calcium exchanger membrane region, EF-hand domain pair n=2 Tax=Rosa chinensis TaxID=74649 RepID=A0A2P6QA71_ROSCH|nr:putative sodium/calcium exchanger membrane region, EF-hand domain pair [Rosa chinensis]
MNTISKNAVYFILVLFAVLVQVRGRSFRHITTVTTSAQSISDGVDDHHHDVGFNQSNGTIRSSFQLLKGIDAESEETCDQLYGFLPCSNSVYGHVFLMVVYEYLLFHGESYLAAGGEQIFKILGPGVFGASAFHVLGALPESLLLLASGFFNTKEIAEEYVYTGVGLLAGTSILLLTIVWGTCVIAGRQHFTSCNDTNSSTAFSWERIPALLTSCGITIDLETRVLARIMIFSVIPFLIMQIPNIFHSSSTENTFILIALGVSVVFLLLYFIYQVFRPWVQKRRLEFVKHGHLVSNILQHVQKHALGRILTVQGAPNLRAIRRLFEEMDEDGDNHISIPEVKKLLQEIKFTSLENDEDIGIAEVMKKFDIDHDGKINKDEFMNGFTKWLDEYKSVHKENTERSLEDIYQVFLPWIQNRRKEREMKKNLMSEVLRHVQSNSLGAILTENGMPHMENIRSLFEQIDLDGNNNISEAELRELIMNIKSGNIPLDVDESVNKLVEELDTSGDHLINEEEFVTGLTKWMNKSHDTQTLSSLESEDDLYQRTWDATDKLVDEETRSGGPVDKSLWGWFKAISYMVVGFVVLAVLAEPLIDNVQDFSGAAGVPSFFVAFVLVPLATNARQAISAIRAASRQTPRTTDLTFSEIYGGVFMNNVLGFSVLLAIIYVREMTWEFSAEVLVVLIVCIVVGLIASLRSTFPLWTAFVAFLLYPVSLLLVYIINDPKSKHPQLRSSVYSHSLTLSRRSRSLSRQKKRRLIVRTRLLKKRLTSTLRMVEMWWSLLAAIPAVVAGQAFRVKKRRDDEQKLKSARGREKSSDEIFVCERVCTSKRMLKKVGAFSKDPIPDTCVTVCGVSELDVCADACALTICVNQHQLPNWNDICLRRCQSECLKLSSLTSN